MLDWIKSFLLNRKVLNIKKVKSDKLKFGTRQGLIYRPIRLKLYTNSLRANFPILQIKSYEMNIVLLLQKSMEHCYLQLTKLNQYLNCYNLQTIMIALDWIKYFFNK